MDRLNIWLLVAVVVLAGGLFVVDLLVPLGVAVWLPYVAVVLVSLWFPQRWQTYSAAAACSALMVLGLFMSPPGGGPFWTSTVNRFLGIFAVWVAAVVGMAARRTLELQEANRKLQAEIAERERLQARLLRTQRLESIGVLASGIAHDFNNLLTPILMAVKLLKEERPEEERGRLLETLQASAQRGADVVRQLLSFAGGTDGQHGHVSLKPILKEVKSILDHTFPKGIQIEFALSDEPLAVLGDATQLSQVLMNLCVNARDAMAGGGTLKIVARNTPLDEDFARLRGLTRAGPHVVLSISDTGTGMDAEVLDKVFDPFFTTKEHGKGTGLGLSTALGIVKAHGGFIDVASDVGRGSCFTVYLPATAESKCAKDESVRSEVRVGGGKLILVVDDEPLIRETAKATLEGHGYSVVVAGDGREALAICQRLRGQLKAVILDMVMPEMDGAAAAAALWDLDRDIPVIASSGNRASRPGNLHAGNEKAFLQKPYTDDQLLAALNKVLRP